MSNINEHKLRLNGVANLSKGLEFKNYDLVIKNAEVRKTEDLPRDDGSYDRVYTLRISELSEIQIIGDREAISAKKVGKQSRLLRFLIEQRAEELGEEKKDFYTKEMSIIIENYKNGEETYRPAEEREIA